MKNIKRIVSIICVILLVGLYVATFIMAIADHSQSMGIFKGLVALCIFVPIISYCYICLHKFAMTRSGRKDYYTSDKDSGRKESDKPHRDR